MPAGVLAPTFPFCRACGWHVTTISFQYPDRAADDICDSCGDDLLESGFAAAEPPTALLATAGSLQVTFTWTDNPDADSTDFRHQTDGGAFTLVSPDTSPTVVVAGAGEVVSGQVRSVLNGVAGAWSTADEATATA